MTPIEKCLKTWYPIDHPLHNDPLHPALGLAGKAGKLLDLYEKERFKEGFSWWDCVHCGHSFSSHIHNEGKIHCCTEPVKSPDTNILYDCHCQNYTPKILDELGDFWYYLRILAYQFEVDLDDHILQASRKRNDSDLPILLTDLNFNCASFLLDCHLKYLINSFKWLQIILQVLDCTLDQLTELNWQKLKDGNNNG